MSEIPEDIAKVADSIAADIPSRVTDTNRIFAACVIARAILAERKRCAEISYSGIIPGHFYATGITSATYQKILSGEQS